MDIEDFSSKALTVIFGFFVVIMCVACGFLAYGLATNYQLLKGICTAFGAGIIICSFFISKRLAQDGLMNTAALLFFVALLLGVGLIVGPLFVS